MDEIIEAGKKAIVEMLAGAQALGVQAARPDTYATSEDQAILAEAAKTLAEAANATMATLTVAFHNADHENEEAGAAAQIKEFMN